MEERAEAAAEGAGTGAGSEELIRKESAENRQALSKMLVSEHPVVKMADAATLAELSRQARDEQKFRSVLTQWERQFQLRITFGRIIVSLVILQTLFIDILGVYMILSDIASDLAIQLLAGTVFVQVVGLGYTVVRFLFPAKGSGLEDLLSKI